MKICIKETIFNGIEAKPEIIPCCHLRKEDIIKIKFIHKKECNGCVFEGNIHLDGNYVSDIISNVN